MSKLTRGLTGCWTYFTEANSPLPKGPIVLPFVAALPDRVWMNVSTFQGWQEQSKEHGLFLTDGINWTEYKLGERGLPRGWIQPGIVADTYARLWFDMVLPSGASALCCFDGKTTTIYETLPSGLPFSVAAIVDLYIDKLDRIWISTLGQGIYTLSDGHWDRIESMGENSLCTQATITTFGEDREGNLWLACTDANGTRFLSGRSGIWELICPCPVRLKGNALDIVSGYNRHFIVDKSGEIWFGGAHIRLMVWNGRRWTQFTERDCPLFTAGISGLMIDEFDNVWVGTGSGCAIFDGIEWTIWGAIIPNSDQSPISYGGSLSLSEFHGPDAKYTLLSGAVVMDGIGRKWLSSPMGIVMFSPEERNDSH